MKRLTIIIPVYNGERYIGKLLDSLQKQMIDDIEVLVIDDGSKDDTYAVCQRSGVQVFHQENQGAGAARNTGLAHAMGEYVVFVDADDMVLDDYVESVLEMTKSQQDLYQFQWAVGSGEEGYRPLEAPFEKGGISFDAYMKHVAQQKTNVLWNKVYKRAIIEKNQLRFQTDIGRGEDILFLLEYLMRVKRIEMSDKYLYQYYLNPNGLCGKVKLSYFEDEKKVYDAFCTMQKQINVDMTGEIYQAFLRNTIRTIGQCMAQGYKKRDIQTMLKKTGTDIIIRQGRAYGFADILRKELFRFRLFTIIQLLTKKRTRS